MDAFLFPILLVGIAAMLYFQIRKQKRAAQEQQKLQNSLQAGDRVMTTSGLFGTVVETRDDSIELEIATGVTTTWLRQAVREKVDTADAQETSDAEDSAAEQEADNSTTTTAGSSAEETADEQVEKQKTS